MAHNFSDFKNRLAGASTWLDIEYGQIHTGRATPMVLDSVMVESYGALQPLKNVGSVSVEDAKTLRVVPWDKSVIKGIEKAISSANLGLSVATDDQGLRVIFPQLTTENRERLVKVLKDKLEDARITVRKERDNEQNAIKAEELPEDDARRAKEDMQKLVDEANANLEAVFTKKETEVLGK